ncbi:MAG: LamG domain-containing protein [Candidatus Marsarchaeota archaeon]|nr:LamG domain-containing protein [Candidatus Marsarchaeota archaeon]
MELRFMDLGSSKGQLMTLIMLVIFVLMLAELFAFALLNISSNNIAQSLTISSVSNNYGSTLRASASTFAAASLSKAITTLADYESRPGIRKANLISNTSLYLSDLVVNGALPNDTSGYPENAMGNLTLAKYNTSVSSLLGFASQVIAIRDTVPKVFQADPYHLQVAYTETVTINSSGSNYTYTVPVNASVSLNNTPDLFYSQQGVSRNIAFSSLNNITSVIGGAQATAGNTMKFAYGTVYVLPSNSVSGASCSVPSKLNSPPISTNLIIATYNAIGLESCMDNYAGLITYISPSSTPSVPYLIYPSSSNVLASMPTGMSVLLYGPALETLNIEGLRSAIGSGSYFASQFTPSYLDRGQGSFASQSPNGIFTFANYNRQVGNFDGSTSRVSLPNTANIVSSQFTASAWVNVNTFQDGRILGNDGYGNYNGQFGLFTNSGGVGVLLQNSASSSQTQISYGYTTTGTWIYVVATYNGTAVKLYFNGSLVSQATPSLSMNTASTYSMNIGTEGNAQTFFDGQISNVQLYNTALSALQIQKMYQEGVSNLPMSGNVVGWWPLNGNANDYSGNGNNGTATSVPYTLMRNYSRDSILNVPVQTKLFPIPGALSCTSSSDCASNSLPNLYLGNMPLEKQNGQTQVAGFLGANSYIVSENALTAVNTMTILWWTNVNSVIASGSGMGPASCQVYEPTSTSGTTFPVEFDPCSCTGYSTCSNNAALSVPKNTWVMVSYVINGNLINAYAYYSNTVLQNNAILPTASMTIPSRSFYISGYGGNPIYEDLLGNVLNVQFYNTPLTQNQIASIYAQGAYGTPITANLIGWWPLNGNANDYSGNGNNASTFNAIYSHFSGNYLDPGMSSLSVHADEWQALGLAG